MKTLKLHATPASFKFKKRIKARIADAAAALRAVDDKLGQMQDDFDDSAKSSCDIWDVKEPRYAVRFLWNNLDLESAEEPTYPARVFSAIASHGNTKSANTPHLEGVIIGLMIAETSLESALDLADQFDRGEIDAAHETPYAAWSIVKGIVAKLGCSALIFDHNKALEDITAAQPVRRVLALAA